MRHGAGENVPEELHIQIFTNLLERICRQACKPDIKGDASEGIEMTLAWRASEPFRKRLRQPQERRETRTTSGKQEVELNRLKVA
jgi:hypothetical protein